MLALHGSPGETFAAYIHHARTTDLKLTEKVDTVSSVFMTALTTGLFLIWLFMPISVAQTGPVVSIASAAARSATPAGPIIEGGHGHGRRNGKKQRQRQTSLALQTQAHDSEMGVPTAATLLAATWPAAATSAASPLIESPFVIPMPASTPCASMAARAERSESDPQIPDSSALYSASGRLQIIRAVLAAAASPLLGLRGAAAELEAQSTSNTTAIVPPQDRSDVTVGALLWLMDGQSVSLGSHGHCNLLHALPNGLVTRPCPRCAVCMTSEDMLCPTCVAH